MKERVLEKGGGEIEVHIPPWVFTFRLHHQTPVLKSYYRTDKDRINQSEDLSPPQDLVRRATSLAEAQASLKKPFQGGKDKQLPLPF